jgi:hypothetical protein
MVSEAEVACPWTFEDFSLWVDCLVDELWTQIAPRCRRPGPAPVCSDADLVTMALIGEAKGWDQETELLSAWAQHRDLFPCQPSRTRFNWRRRALQGAINELRRLLLTLLDLAQDRQGVLDSLPIPVIRFHLVPRANRAQWQADDARFGKVPSKKGTIFGDKRSLLVTLNGVILDVVLAPAQRAPPGATAPVAFGQRGAADHRDGHQPTGRTGPHRGQPRPELLGLDGALAHHVDRTHPLPLSIASWESPMSSTSRSWPFPSSTLAQ